MKMRNILLLSFSFLFYHSCLFKESDNPEKTKKITEIRPLPSTVINDQNYYTNVRKLLKDDQEQLIVNILFKKNKNSPFKSQIRIHSVNDEIPIYETPLGTHLGDMALLPHSQILMVLGSEKYDQEEKFQGYEISYMIIDRQGYPVEQIQLADLLRNQNVPCSRNQSVNENFLVKDFSNIKVHFNLNRIYSNINYCEKNVVLILDEQLRDIAHGVSFDAIDESHINHSDLIKDHNQDAIWNLVNTSVNNSQLLQISKLQLMNQIDVSFLNFYVALPSNFVLKSSCIKDNLMYLTGFIVIFDEENKRVLRVLEVVGIDLKNEKITFDNYYTPQIENTLPYVSIVDSKGNIVVGGTTNIQQNLDGEVLHMGDGFIYQIKMNGELSYTKYYQGERNDYITTITQWDTDIFYLGGLYNGPMNNQDEEVHTLFGTPLFQRIKLK